MDTTELRVLAPLVSGTTRRMQRSFVIKVSSFSTREKRCEGFEDHLDLDTYFPPFSYSTNQRLLSKWVMRKQMMDLEEENAELKTKFFANLYRRNVLALTLALLQKEAEWQRKVKTVGVGYGSMAPILPLRSRPMSRKWKSYAQRVKR